MPEPIDYYFDFSSPYGYLVSGQIDEMAARFGRSVTWRPILLGLVFPVTGQSAVVDQPLRGDYARHDWPRFARLLGIPYVEPARFPIPTQAAARSFYWLTGHDAELAKRLARALYHAYFGEGIDISAPRTVIEIAATLGVEEGALEAALEDQRVKERAKQETEAAMARGVFGSPTFVVDGEMFWGADRLWQVRRWLDWGGW